MLLNMITTQVRGALSCGFEEHEIAAAPEAAEQQILAAESEADLMDAEQSLAQAQVMEDKAAGLEEMALIAEGMNESEAEGPATETEVAMTDLAADLATGGTDAELEVFNPDEANMAGQGLEAYSPFKRRNVGVEGIKEMAKNFWETVKRLVEKAIDAFIAFYRKITDRVPGVVKEARKVSARAEDSLGKVVKEKKTKISTEAKTLALGDNAPKSFGDVKKGLDNTIDVAKSLLGDYAKQVVDGGDRLADAIGSFDVDKADASLKKCNVAVEKITSKAPVFANHKVSGDSRFTKAQSVTRSEMLPGGVAIFTTGIIQSTSGMSEVAVASLYRSFQFGVHRHNDKDVKDFSSAEITTLTPNEVEKICETVEDLMGYVKQFQSKHQRNLEKAAKKIKDAGSKAAGRVKDDTTVPAQRAYRAGMNYATAYAGWCSSPFGRVVSIALAASTAALSVCSKSLSNYGAA